MKEEQDLTTGCVSKKLILFAVPLLFGNLLQSFYSIVDMLVVGRFVGETGLAAISNASMISFIINSICIGVTMGGTVLVAQYKGANDEKGQSETAGTLFSNAFIAVATVVNVLLDIILVGLAGMGTAGAAYATIFSQGISFVISIFHLRRKKFVFQFKLKSFTLKTDKLAAILKVGL